MDFDQTFQELLTKLISFIPNLIVALITFIGSLMLAKPASRWVKQKIGKELDDPETLRLIERITRWCVIIPGTLIALDQVEFDITGFLTGLGIVGLTIGFALQDIARNFVAGVLLLIRQPFNIRDTVSVAGYEGTVLDITTRDTVIKTLDGKIVIIANTNVFSDPIINYSQNPYRRRDIKIGLGYEQDIDHAIAVFLKTIQEVAGVLDDPAPSIYAEELGDSALILSVYFWIDQRTHNIFETHSQAIIAINNAAEREGIQLPYPTQMVKLQQD
ncbi:MAG: mechanosensitive ion channel [Anaerolineae bacterium]|nr:mechanosensitive ion channel [Anaerolineae bacterium]